MGGGVIGGFPLHYCWDRLAVTVLLLLLLLLPRKHQGEHPLLRRPVQTPHLAALAWIDPSLSGIGERVGECGRMVDQSSTLGILPESYVGNHAVWNVEEV